ncbi:hypothetical protein ACCO45_000695 [Purpureocillium lilacinum]|uniref:Uncharacterized protein n=1 Tax=Purpureocillium lilacinum TaxID=33203 RepID=A0ACC4E4X4_PURLI
MPRVVLRLEMFHDSANHHHCERQRPRSFSPSYVDEYDGYNEHNSTLSPSPSANPIPVERSPSVPSPPTPTPPSTHTPSRPGSCLARRVELRSAARPLNLSSSVPSSPEHTHSSQSASAESASLSGRRFGRPAQPILLRLGPSHSAQSRVPYSYGTGTAWTSPSFNSVPYSYEFLTPAQPATGCVLPRYSVLCSQVLLCSWTIAAGACGVGWLDFARRAYSITVNKIRWKLSTVPFLLTLCVGSGKKERRIRIVAETDRASRPLTYLPHLAFRRAFIPSTIRQPNKALVAPRLRQTVRVLYTSLWTLVTSFTWTPGAVLGAVITTITSSSTTKQATSLATSTSTGRTDIHPHPARPGRTLLQSQRRKRASLVLAQLSRPKTSYAAATSPASPTFATRETLYLGLPSSGLRLIPGRPPLHCLASVPAQQASASTQPAALRLDHRGDAGFPHL